MAMYAPAHPGELIRDNMLAVGWSVRECAEHLGTAEATLADVLAGRASLSSRLALALERLGWSTAEFWMRVQAGYVLAEERRRQTAT